MVKKSKKLLTILSPILGAGAVGACPLCWIGTASLLTYLGLGALIPVWQWIVVGLLALAFLGFLLDFRSHGNFIPTILLVAGGVLLLYGRYGPFAGAGFTGWPIWGAGAVLIIIAIIYNKKMFKKNQPKNLYACPVCQMKYKEESIAKKCEIWCREHKSCNLDIIKNAVKEGE